MQLPTSCTLNVFAFNVSPICAKTEPVFGVNTSNICVRVFNIRLIYDNRFQFSSDFTYNAQANRNPNWRKMNTTLCQGTNRSLYDAIPEKKNTNYNFAE